MTGAVTMWRVRGLALASLGAVLLVSAPAGGQERHMTGQNVVPVFEGWERNPDGSFNMVFGYMNRNYGEEVDVPIGADNRFEPGEPDQGQPTHFYNRRQQFMFKVRVPKDWGDRKDLVWTLTSHGKTERAYGSLWPVWEIDRNVYQQNRGGPGELGEPDEPPSIALVGPSQRNATVGVALTLTVNVADDGRPTARPTRSGTNASGGASAAGRTGPRPQNPIVQAVVRLDPGMRLGVIWVVHRRSLPAPVAFDPMKVAVSEGKATTRVTFSQPGVYVLRGYADDGILLSSTDVVVTVKAG